MLEELQWKQVAIIRAITVNLLDTISEDEADKIPDGWNNNIRWNMGHILNTQDQLTHRFAGVPLQLPERFDKRFGNRTKPADWNEPVPSLGELRTLLAEQPERLRSLLRGRLEERVNKPFVRLGHEMGTIGELLQFSLYHEGLHQGAIGGLRKAIAQQRMLGG